MARRFRRSRLRQQVGNVRTSGRTMTASVKYSRRSAGRQRTFARAGNVAAPPVPKPGPQNLVRQVTGERISGRPDQEEQQQLAATVGAALHQLRLAQRLSIRDLERRSGVSRQMVSLLE